MNRFTLILLPHLQDSYCTQAEVTLHQLSPMSNACLIIWNFTLLVSSLVLPSYWINEYLLASTWNKEANLSKYESGSLCLIFTPHQTLGSASALERNGGSIPGYLLKGQWSFPSCNRCSKGRWPDVAQCASAPNSQSAECYSWTSRLGGLPSGILLLKLHFLTPTTFKWGHPDYYNIISIKNRNITLWSDKKAKQATQKSMSSSPPCQDTGRRLITRNIRFLFQSPQNGPQMATENNNKAGFKYIFHIIKRSWVHLWKQQKGSTSTDYSCQIEASG